MFEPSGWSGMANIFKLTFYGTDLLESGLFSFRDQIEYRRCDIANSSNSNESVDDIMYNSDPNDPMDSLLSDEDDLELPLCNREIIAQGARIPNTTVNGMFLRI